MCLDSSSDDDSVGDQVPEREVRGDRGSGGRERSSGADTSSTGGSARDTPPHPKTAHVSQQQQQQQSIQQQLQQQQQQQQHRHHHHHHHTKYVNIAFCPNLQVYLNYCIFLYCFANYLIY